jgi:perosamine synthetase
MTTTTVKSELLHIINQVLNRSSTDKFVSLHEPFFQGNEWHYVKECIDTGWVSSVGKYVDQFGRDLEKFTGIKHAIPTMNGTAALHMSFLLAGVTRDDEVLVPSLTFVASCNAISYTGAICHFVDSDPHNLGVDARKLADYLQEIAEVRDDHCINKKTGRIIRALCVVHIFGHPADMDALIALCDKYRITLVEDAAEALGTYYKGIHVGAHGKVGALSFNGNKIITTGGGGAILTNDDEIAKLAKHLTTTAKIPNAQWRYEHYPVGYNYRLPNINAALGCAQLEKMPEYLHKKRLLANRYQQALANSTEYLFVKEPSYAKSNYWLNAIRVADLDLINRNELLNELNHAGIMARPVWDLMHSLKMYQECPRMDLSNAIKLETQLINLPSSVFL